MVESGFAADPRTIELVPAGARVLRRPAARYPAVGQQLTCAPAGSVAQPPSKISYVWMVPGRGAAGQQYTVRSSDAGGKVCCQIQARKRRARHRPPMPQVRDGEHVPKHLVSVGVDGSPGMRIRRVADIDLS